MQTGNPVTRDEFEQATKAITRLKQEIIQLRKLLKKNTLREFSHLKSREVQQMLRISATTLQNMRNKRRISYTRLDGKLLYEYNDVKNLLYKQKITAL